VGVERNLVTAMPKHPALDALEAGSFREMSSEQFADFTRQLAHAPLPDEPLPEPEVVQKSANMDEQTSAAWNDWVRACIDRAFDETYADDIAETLGELRAELRAEIAATDRVNDEAIKTIEAVLKTVERLEKRIIALEVHLGESDIAKTANCKSGSNNLAAPAAGSPSSSAAGKIIDLPPNWRLRRGA
jgi:hypothetical protein